MLTHSTFTYEAWLDISLFVREIQICKVSRYQTLERVLRQGGLVQIRLWVNYISWTIFFIEIWALVSEVLILEVERAGNFKSSSWAEPEIFSIWWAELSRAARKLQNDELSWAELARAKWAEKWAEKQLKIRNLVSQTSSYLNENT